MAPARLEIQLSSGRSRPLLNVQAYVEVGVVGGGSATRGYTDFNGRIRFDVLSGNRYQLTVSGPGIESKTVMFDIPPEQRFHREVIDVELHTAGTTAKGPGGLVSASTLCVPEKARHEFEKGMKEMSAHNWNKAREHLDKAIKYYPQFDWAYNNLGVAYIQEKNTKAARGPFEEAVAINDKNADGFRNLARMELMDIDSSGGMELLLKLGPDPHDLDALMMLLYAQLKLRDSMPDERSKGPSRGNTFP